VALFLSDPRSPVGPAITPHPPLARKRHRPKRRHHLHRDRPHQYHESTAASVNAAITTSIARSFGRLLSFGFLTIEVGTFCATLTNAVVNFLEAPGAPAHQANVCKGLRLESSGPPGKRATKPTTLCYTAFDMSALVCRRFCRRFGQEWPLLLPMPAGECVIFEGCNASICKVLR
jgi:hypothetical protein